MRVLLLNRTLGIGGIQRQIVSLARGLRGAGHDVAVAVLYGGGEFEDVVRSAGIPVHDLKKRGSWESVRFFWRLARLIGREKPDVVHSFGSVNVIAAALKQMLRSVKLVWGIRTSMQELGAYSWITQIGDRLEALATHVPDAIISNSEAGRRMALARRNDDRNVFVIPNGIDCQEFRPDPEGGERVRREWGIPLDGQVVGIVARLDPVKDHPNFLRAAARVASGRTNVWFACIGGGPPPYRRHLEQMAAELGMASRLVWTGERRATRAEYSALDVAVLSSSHGEGFPNVVAEAMACGRPVAATDSGDTRVIVDDTGVIVPTSDPDALAHGMVELLERTRGAGPELSARVRARIELEYSVPALVRRTVRVLEQVRASA